jgi:Zn-finger nucleic acid-binding protein
MPMHCPICKPPQSLDLAPLEEGKLPARRCSTCHGHWIRSTDFWRWCAQRGENIPESPASEVPITAPEVGGFRLCPDCDYVMARYHVGHGLGFTVDRCRNCEGAWLDGGEWDALRVRNLHDDLPRIFDDAWQRAVRRDVHDQTIEESFRRRLGDDDYRRAQELRAWLDPHPKRSELFAYLQLKQRRE